MSDKFEMLGDTRQILNESGVDMAHIIEITPETERRVMATRRMSDREKLARLQLDLERARNQIAELQTFIAGKSSQ